MSPRERCDEIVRLIDEVLAASEAAVSPAPVRTIRPRQRRTAPSPTAA